MDASKRVSSFVSLRSSNNLCNAEQNRRCGQEHKLKPYGQKSERRQFFHGVNHFAKITHMFFLLSISEGYKQKTPPVCSRAGFSLLKGEVLFRFIGRHWSVRRVGFRRLRRMALAQPGFVV